MQQSQSNKQQIPTINYYPFTVKTFSSSDCVAGGSTLKLTGSVDFSKASSINPDTEGLVRVRSLGVCNNGWPEAKVVTKEKEFEVLFLATLSQDNPIVQATLSLPGRPTVVRNIAYAFSSTYKFELSSEKPDIAELPSEWNSSKPYILPE